MSAAISTLLSLAGGAAITALATDGDLSFIGDVYLQTPFRSIGTIIPDLMIEEIGRDELEITYHPVERGSPIADNAFRRPVELLLRAGWSNSGQYPGYVTDVYQALLSLQKSLQLITIFTGKRFYDNMLIQSLVQTTNERSGEYTLMVQAHCREVLIVSTQAAQAPPASSQSQPQQTASTEKAGSKQLTTPATGAQKSLTTNQSSITGLGNLPTSSIFANPSAPGSLTTAVGTRPFIIGGGA